MIRHVLFVLMCALSCAMIDADAPVRRAAKPKPFSNFCGQKSRAACKDRGTCQYCYCAFKCGPREKKPDDTLIWVPNDKNGLYCYCKQRDIDYFNKNGCGLAEGLEGFGSK